MKYAIATAAVLLAGCATVTTDNLTAVDDATLCGGYKNQYNKAAHPQIREEINRRNLIPAEQWHLVDANRIQVDMTRCAALASWGTPREINQASYGDQLVYCRDGFYCISNQYVYIRGNRVTGWN